MLNQVKIRAFNDDNRALIHPWLTNYVHCKQCIDCLHVCYLKAIAEMYTWVTWVKLNIQTAGTLSLSHSLDLRSQGFVAQVKVTSIVGILIIYLTCISTP